MTLLPSESWDVQIVRDRGPYKPNEICSVPGCTKYAQAKHHIWRRSFTGAPADWVLLDDGTIVGNLTGLCIEHHDDVTGMTGGHDAWIKWEDGELLWYVRGQERSDLWFSRGVLDPQPPIEIKKASLGALPEQAPESAPHEHDGQSAERCPACGKPKKERAKLAPGEKRTKSRYVVVVPEDEKESGTEVIETLMAEWKKIRDRWDEASDYYALVELLAFGVQHAHLITTEES